MECRVRKHDRSHFEVKLAYPLSRDKKQRRYQLDLYLFFPYPLGINQSHYGPDLFYRDLHYYVRFKTPDFDFDGLLNAGLSTSPLTRVRKHIDEARTGRSWDERHLTYEIKMLANVVKVRARDAFRRYGRELERAATPEMRRNLAGQISLFLQGLAAALQAVHGLRTPLSFEAVPEEIRRTYAWIDEYASMEVEDILLRFLRQLERRDDKEMAPTRARLAALAQEETAYRRDRGYPTLASSHPRHNEKYLYRESLLKKFAASVLFLSVEQRVGDQRARHVAGSVAAGMAMAFAVAATWLAQRHWPQWSVQFVLVLVLAYIFKDRIKDFLREYGTRLLPRWTRDRTGRLVDPQYGNRVGRTRETMRWREERETPKEVMEARKDDDLLERAVERGTEHILHFREEVRLAARVIHKNHQRATAVDEILRLDVSRWLRRMDNAVKTVYRIDEAGKLQQVPSPRTYTVDMVLQLTSESASRKIVKPVRLILNRKGIVRIE